MAKAILTALYLRASTDEQTESIPAQRQLLERYAPDHQLQPAGEYVDAGRSGDSFAKRTGLQQLLADAKRGKFAAVLVRDLSRLSRRNSLRTAKQIIGPLLDCNVAIYTAMQGDLQITSSTGRIILAVLGEMDHCENVKRAMNVVNGQLRAATNGSWIGRAPYAYRVTGGKHQKQLQLGDPQEQAVVQRVYAAFDAGESTVAIVAQLNAEQIPAPQAATWNYHAIGNLLRNPAYCGDYRFNVRAAGKYYHTAGGRPQERSHHYRDEDCEQVITSRNDPADWIVHREHWPAIVDRQLWDRVQRQLDKCARSRAPVDHFLFSSLLTCSKCQQTLWGSVRKGVRRYACQCCKAAVTEQQLLQETARSIKRQAGPAAIAELRRSLERKLQQPATKPATAAALQKQIDKQERKLLLLDPEPDLLRPVQKEIRRLRAELDQQQRAEQAATICTATAKQSIEQALARFFRLPDILAGKSNTEVRNLLRQTIARIDLRIDSAGEGNRRRYSLKAGDIYAHAGTGQEIKF